MILQKVQLDNKDIQGTQTLYYRIDGNYSNSEKMILMPGAKLHTNTYFNSFSLGKWFKYTIIDNAHLQLKAEGCFRLLLYHSEIEKDTVKNSLVQKIEYKLDKLTEIKVELPMDKEFGNYYFTIEAEEQTIIYQVNYKTNTKENQIKIAIVVCTFRREEMVKKCVDKIINEIFNNENSRIGKKIQLYIIDNGRTLESEIRHPFVCVIPNKNYGGAGGFTRGIIAAIEKENEFSHVLLMDDDAIVSSEAIEMTYALLSLMRPEYKDYVIGGGLMRQDIPYLQYEAGAQWNYGKINACNHNLDMREYKNVLFNELDSNSIDYNGWWYCCIPLSRIKKIKLPLPIFIHRDDIEYGMRMSKQFIYMNGISVWHEAFENKMQGVLDYYELRNLAITNSIHSKEYSPSAFKRFFVKRCLNNIFKNEYQYVEYNIKAVEDFCKGIDAFKNLDPEKLHKELLDRNYKSKPITDLESEYPHLKGHSHKLDLEKYEPSGLRRKRNNILSTLIFNGMLLPLRRQPVILQSNMPMYCNFAAKTTIHTDVGDKAFVTRHSYRKIFKSLLKIRKACKVIDQHFGKCSKEFNERYIELIDLEFWKTYLDI